MKNSLKYKDFKNNNIDEYILNLFDKEANKRKKIEESESYDSFNQKIINLFIGKRKFEITNNLFNFYKSSTLYVCNDCLELYDLEISFKRHIKKCSKIIAGSYVVYHDENIKIFKIQGLDNISICQNICNIGRCFIKNKTLFWDIENYNFFLLFENNIFAGYFSEEILNSDNNLSCITIFPDFQKKGYGLLLVDFSYYLKKGTCEKPLSVDGINLYNKYWKNKIFLYLKKNNGKSKSIKNIADDLNMNEDDVITGLNLLNAKLSKRISVKNIKIKNINFVKIQCIL